MEDTALGFADDPMEKSTLANFTTDDLGTVWRDFSDAIQVVEIGILAWRHVPKAVCQYAWVSRGFVDREQIADADRVSPDDVVTW